MSHAYRCLQTPLAESEYRLVTYREQDLERIRQWRNDQMNVLRQKQPLSEADQLAYYRDAILPSIQASSPSQILVSVLRDEECIAYGGLTGIDWTIGRAEVSFLADTARARDVKRYSQDFAAFLRLLRTLAFERLRLNRLFTETYDVRPHHVAVLEANGFQLEGRLRRHILVDGQVADVLFHGMLRQLA